MVMAGSWLERLLGRGGAAADDKLREAAEAGDWDTVLAQARRILRRRSQDVALLSLAARARLERWDEDDPEAALTEAVGWLEQALEQSADDRDALYLRGLAAYYAEQRAEAEACWRRALTAHGADPEVREALVKLWVDSGQLPEWGVPVVEATLLDGDG